MLKSIIKNRLKKRGLSIVHDQEIPFGVKWCEDIACCRGTGYEPIVCLDVGANIGQTARQVTSTFPDAIVHCFEPVPETFDQLRRNTANLHGVHLHDIALSDRAGESQMTLADASGRNRIDAAGNGQQVSVRVETIDNFCSNQNLPAIHVLKIDVEGHELSVLRGASAMLEQGNVDFIVSECDFFARENQPHCNFMELLDFVKPFGFHVVSFYTEGVDRMGWVWGDVLLARPGAMMLQGTVCSPRLGETSGS